MHYGNFFLCCGLVLFGFSRSSVAQQHAQPILSPSSALPQERVVETGKKKDPLKKEMKQLRARAKKGDVDSQIRLGSCYFSGSLGMPRDYALAAHWYARAAQQGSAIAQFNLGICYDRGVGVKQDSAKALEYYLKAADQGMILAQLNAATSLRDLGRSKEAAVYYRKAADNGNTVACREYARILLKGTPTAKDVKYAMTLLQKAVDKGDPRALVLLADCYGGQLVGIPQDGKKMFDLLWRAAEADIPEALSKIGFCYEEGIGVKRDTAAAVRWYLKAVKKGHPQAMVNLADCYLNGRGVGMDEKKAFFLYRRAAEAGFPLGVYNLGVCYINGLGVKKDEKKAFQLFSRAAKAGVVRAQYNLAVCYEEGCGVTADPASAFFWYSKAAKKKDPLALYETGMCFLTGKGVAKNREKAVSFLRQAASRGNHDAQTVLQQLKKQH